MKLHLRKCPNGAGEVGRWDAEAAGVLVSVRVVVDGICVAVSVWATLYVGQWLRRPTPSHTKPIPRWDVHFGILKRTERTPRLLI